MRQHLALTAALAAALSLSACAGNTGTEPAAGSTPTVNTGQESHHAEDGHDHGADEHYGIPDVTWDVASEKSLKDTAAKAMALFARPDVPETTWFAELAPHLAPEYAEDAKYIDPARVPIRKITDGPAISRDAGNPMTATATFATDAGRWQMLLHRSGQQQPWLVTAISPQNPTS
ncbi:hypothetical protein J2T11_003244 [Paenarthrobacter nicotinovorans]|uniref:hypothetical protein n=1 Tax=Paenarthrobacter nicotinovorans TaxID=29320 RepID=UPI0027815580|nr:hypothetical protein [Paenarthrobacter nicotinovorans]MDP9936876.1 hypothetical protein [Paenarthrobacter nicotinovorans]